MLPSRDGPRTLNEIVQCHCERLGDGHDDHEPRVGALSLFDLCQRLSRNMGLESEFGASQALFYAGLPQDDSHRAP